MAEIRRDRLSLGQLGWLAGGLLAWSAHFGAVYGFVSVVCGRGLAGRTVLGFPLVASFVAVATAAALAATAAMLAKAWRDHRDARRAGRRTDGFLASCTAFVNGISLLAIGFNALPAILVPLCP